MLNQKLIKKIKITYPDGTIYEEEVYEKDNWNIGWPGPIIPSTPAVPIQPWYCSAYYGTELQGVKGEKGQPNYSNAKSAHD